MEQWIALLICQATFDPKLVHLRGKGANFYSDQSLVFFGKEHFDAPLQWKKLSKLGETNKRCTFVLFEFFWSPVFGTTTSHVGRGEGGRPPIQLESHWSGGGVVRRTIRSPMGCHQPDVLLHFPFLMSYIFKENIFKERKKERQITKTVHCKKKTNWPECFCFFTGSMALHVLHDSWTENITEGARLETSLWVRPDQFARCANHYFCYLLSLLYVVVFCYSYS